jgi:hypothetical protein
MIHPKPMVVALAVLTAGGIGIWAWNAGNRGATPHANDPQVTKPATRPAASGDAVSTAFARLPAGSATEEARQSLLDLRKSLMDMPGEEALAVIRGFLASGEDRATGLSFEIAKDGSLSEWPTFRSFLLDVLSAIDPAAAAAIGREILASPTTADEWALALRNVARGEPLEESAAFLRRKTEELINNPAWQAEPSIGYLNAFDVLVHIGAADSAPLLSGLIQRKDRKDLAHAGFLTLDRLVQRQPADLLGRLAADRALQENRPEMVAQQFARADVRDPQQRKSSRHGCWIRRAPPPNCAPSPEFIPTTTASFPTTCSPWNPLKPAMTSPRTTRPRCKPFPRGRMMPRSNRSASILPS